MSNILSDRTTTVQITDDFDLAKIAESGQCYRWEYVHGGEYRIIHDSKCLYISQIGETDYRADCSECEFETIWKPYFDLNENYQAIRERIDRQQDPFLYFAFQEQKGIRILQQDPWETLVSFIISQNKNIPAIRKSIELLSQSAGKRMRDSRGRLYYAFPMPEEIFNMSENSLKACKVGYRWKYIKAAANAVLDGGLDLSALVQADEKETIQRLTGIHGVGPKVASCVSLYGLHHTDAFPMDVWMKRIIANEYSGRYPYERYSPYNGIYQQYMFAFYRKRYAKDRKLKG